MSNELKRSNAGRLIKRADAGYHNKSSIVMRVIRFEPSGENYAAKFINPFLPIAVLNFSEANYPVTGISGADPENGTTITEEFAGVANGFQLFGMDAAALLTEFPSLINFYCTLKGSDADLEYTKFLAELLPEECWIEPKTLTVTDVGAISVLAGDAARLVILEKR